MGKSELAIRVGVSPITIGRIEKGLPCYVETNMWKFSNTVTGRNGPILPKCYIA
jgi:DNA-binding XRE family transcriptional regulator